MKLVSNGHTFDMLEVEDILKSQLNKQGPFRILSATDGNVFIGSLSVRHIPSEYIYIYI